MCVENKKSMRYEVNFVNVSSYRILFFIMIILLLVPLLYLEGFGS